MKITLDIKKSLEENAETYFLKAKQARKKLEGAKRALQLTKKKLTEIEKKEIKVSPKKVPVKKEWFEKFRWFMSSDGFLIIGGRDATTNEIIIKKHAEKKDVVFHTQMAGSPFVVVKSGGKEIPGSTRDEAAMFCLAMGKAWRAGMLSAEVYSINPEQVKKNMGLPKGMFMIYGDRVYYNPVVKLGVGVFDSKVMCGPFSAVKKNCKECVEIIPGDRKVSAVAKELKQKLGFDDLDGIIAVLPPGNCSIKKARRKG